MPGKLLMSISRFFSLLLIVVFALPAISPANAPLDSVHQLLVNGEADAAIRMLKTSLSANPSGAAERNLLCRVHYAEERWDAAVSECERAAKSCASAQA